MAQPSASGPPAEKHRLRLLLAAAFGSIATAGATLIWRKHPLRHDKDEQSGRGSGGPPPSSEAKQAGHETEDMSGRTMMWVLIGLGGLVAASFGLMFLLLGYYHEERSSAPQRFTAEQIRVLHAPQPNLQIDPLGDIARLDRKEDKQLDNYSWVDPGHTRARIPISRALKLVTGHGLDAAP